MKYCKDLYVSESLQKKRKKIISKLNHGKMQLSIYLIVLSPFEGRQLEIIHAMEWRQHVYKKDNYVIVGLVSDFDEALSYMEMMAQKVYEETQDLNLKEYVQIREGML